MCGISERLSTFYKVASVTVCLVGCQPRNVASVLGVPLWKRQLLFSARSSITSIVTSGNHVFVTCADGKALKALFGAGPKLVSLMPQSKLRRASGVAVVINPSGIFELVPMRKLCSGPILKWYVTCSEPIVFKTSFGSFALFEDSKGICKFRLPALFDET